MNGAAVPEAVLAAAEFDPFAGGTIERVIATSEAQREVWLADQLGVAASLAFNESVRLRLCGQLDPAALQGALGALVRRHDALRSTLGPDGADLLVGSGNVAPLECVDLRGLAAAASAAALEAAAASAVETPFDLANGPLLRATLFRLGEEEHVLFMTAHHIVCDGWSWGVIAEDLGLLYAEQTGASPSPEPAPSYADYVAWEAAEAASPARGEDERFWLGRFAGDSVPVLELPTDRLRPPVRTFASRRIDRPLDGALVEAARKTGAKAGASLFATLFSAFAATLSRIAGQDDLVVGVPAAGQSASELLRLVGHCVTLLPVRTSVDAAEPFAAYLQRSASALLDAFEHQNLTFGSLLRKLPLRRDPSRLPLVSVMFNVDQAIDADAGTFPGIAVELTGNARRFENFELFVNASRANGGLVLECQYNTDLFDADTITRWLSAYEALLRAAIAEPARPVGRLDWLDPAQAAALRGLQPATTPVADALMHAGFVRQAAATPDRIALRGDGSALTYAELDQRSNRLARTLRARGVRRGEHVGLCLSRQPDMLVALLAVLKAGGTYVPLDPGFPAARLAFCAEDAALALLVTESTAAVAPRTWRPDAAGRVLEIDTDRGWLDESPEALVPGELDAHPADAAYVIYTSGSTGQPKGVAVPHRAVANFLASMAKQPGIGAEDRLAAVTTLSFDIAVLELLLPLGVGAEVRLVSRDTAMDGRLLAALLESSGATMMQATPGTWRMLVDAGWRGGPTFRALVGGESLPAELADDLLDRTAELWNLYGPTETTVWSTAWRVQRSPIDERGMSIGRPIDNTSVWILDEALQPCPIGVPGEICIGGAGVAIGYLNRPELTADRFVPDPWSTSPAARLYRTGDRGRWRSDGLLAHLGRLDFQVKVRGYRIELGEIEAACEAQPGVARSVVLAREDRPGDVRLVAYLAATAGMTIDEASLRAALRARLPDYMLPQHVVTLPRIPELPNGKIDRRALPAPLAVNVPVQPTRLAPRTPLQRQVLDAMEAVLNLPGLALDDDFFAIGGHSLLASRLTSRLSEELGISLPVRTIFEAPTAERLAAAAEAALVGGTPRGPLIEHRSDRREAPLTMMQERIRFMEELVPGRVVYNTPSAHRLTGPLDRSSFETALRGMMRRQPALRTVIARSSDKPVQRVLDDVALDLPFEDLQASPATLREAELMRRMQAIIDRPIGLHEAPLFRVALYRLAPEEHVFLFMAHHIVWDGWSFDLLYQEVAALYAAAVSGLPACLPVPAVTYLDFAEWHCRWMQSDECLAQVGFWKKRFAEVGALTPLPTDRPRGAAMSGVGSVEWVHVDKALTERLRDVARRFDATLNMLVMAVYAAMLGEALDGRSLVLGIPVRGRPGGELESIMGFFNNLLPTPLVIDPASSLHAWTSAVKRELLDSFAHQDVPFERLAAEPEIAAHANKAGLYQSLYSFQDARQRQRSWGGLEHRAVLVMQKGATEDFSLWLMEVPGGLEGGINYNADVFDAATAELMHARLMGLLRRVAETPEVTVAELLASPGDDAERYRRWLQARKAAQVADPGIAPIPAASAARASAAEAGLASIWAELLGIDAAQVAADDNFFDIGGNSLLAMRAVADSERILGLTVDPPRYVHETLRQLTSVPSATSDSKPPPAAAGAAPTGLLSRMLGRFGRRP